MAKEGLVPVSYAYKRMTMSDLQFRMHAKDIEGDDFKEDLLMDLVYLCTFGLENPLRLNVDQDVSLIKYGTKLNDDSSSKEGGEGLNTSTGEAPTRSSSNVSGKKQRK